MSNILYLHGADCGVWGSRLCSWGLFLVIPALIWLYPGRTDLLLYCSKKMEDSTPRRGRVTFGWLVGLSQVLGLVSVVLTGVWMGHYKGGFAWDGSAQQFNVHPLCMVLGLVFLQGDGESTNTQPPFYECVFFSPKVFGAAGVKWWPKCSKKKKTIMDLHLTPTRPVCLLASTWHVKPPSYISIIYTTADRNAVTAVSRLFTEMPECWGMQKTCPTFRLTHTRTHTGGRKRSIWQSIITQNKKTEGRNKNNNKSIFFKSGHMTPLEWGGELEKCGCLSIFAGTKAMWVTNHQTRKAGTKSIFHVQFQRVVVSDPWRRSPSQRLPLTTSLTGLTLKTPRLPDRVISRPAASTWL